MSILKRIKDSIEAKITNDWEVLDKIDQLDEIKKESFNQATVLFKHSVTCGISSAAKYRLESDWSNINEGIKFYYLDLLSYRPISNAIAQKFDVTHQSPQIIIIKDGQAIHDTSHHSINVADINAALDKHTES